MYEDVRVCKKMKKNTKKKKGYMQDKQPIRKIFNFNLRI